MSETTQKIDIKEISSFKLRVEIMALSSGEPNLVPELSNFTEAELKAEMKRRHEKDKAFLRMELSDWVTDVQAEGKPTDIGYLLTGLFVIQPSLASIFSDAIMVFRCLDEKTKKEIIKHYGQ